MTAKKAKQMQPKAGRRVASDKAWIFPPAKGRWKTQDTQYPASVMNLSKGSKINFSVVLSYIPDFMVRPDWSGAKKLFYQIGRKVKSLSSMDECLDWCNTVKSHGALDLKTSGDTYDEKMPQVDILIDPSILENEVSSQMRNNFPDTR